MRHSRRYDIQGHPRSRSGDDLHPLFGLFFGIVLCLVLYHVLSVLYCVVVVGEF